MAGKNQTVILTSNGKEGLTVMAMAVKRGQVVDADQVVVNPYDTKGLDKAATMILEVDNKYRRPGERIRVKLDA